MHIHLCYYPRQGSDKRRNEYEAVSYTHLDVYKRQDIQFAPANMNRQRAASVGTLGLRYYVAGKTETAMEHEPDYLRLSQAERERKEREAKSIQ